jgi:gamma-glutamylcyclotransferase (GGCT)/AIG2-like uncharacterized protein YtfP
MQFLRRKHIKEVMRMSQKVFVYGTLRQGQANHWLIEKYVKSVKKATVRGWMYDLGAYPAVIEGEGLISGELIEFHNSTEAFKKMDLLEGFYHTGSSNNHYERIITTCCTEDGEEECQIYVYPNRKKEWLQKRASLVISGDWLDKSWLEQKIEN